MLSKCEVTPTKKVIHVELGFKEDMPKEVIQVLTQVLSTWGQKQHDQRAPMPMMGDVKEALSILGAYGRQ